MQKLHPKAVYSFWLKSNMAWVLIFGGTWLFLSFFILKGQFSPSEAMKINLGLLGIIIFGFVIDYILARLTYHFYRYELTEEALRIEKGIIVKRQISIPYERIQNVDIYRGIFERILGLSEINIQTAGYGITAEVTGAEGKLPGLSAEDAEKLREELLRRAKGTRLEV